MSAFGCEVCSDVVGPDGFGDVLVEGITDGVSRAWVWGPVLVHDYCRTLVTTPYDQHLGSGEFIAAWERVPFTVVERGESKGLAADRVKAARAELNSVADVAAGGAA